MTVKFRPNFLESRRMGLQYFLQYVFSFSTFGRLLNAFGQLCPPEPGVLGLPSPEGFSLFASELILDENVRASFPTALPLPESLPALYAYGSFLYKVLVLLSSLLD